MAKFISFDAPQRTAGPINVRPATADDFGGSAKGLIKAGAAGEKVGEQIAAANLRVSNRRDTIAVADFKERFNSGLADEMRRVVAEEDIIQPGVLQAFGTKAVEMQQQYLGDFPGSDDAKAKLSAKMSNTIGILSRELAGLSNKAGIGRVEQVMKTEFNTILQGAVKDWDIQGAFDKTNDVAAEATGALADQKLREDVAAQKQTIITQVFDNALHINDNLEGAKAVLSLTGIDKLVDPKTLLRMRKDVLKVEREADKGERAAQQALVKFAIIKYDSPDLSNLTAADRAAINKIQSDQTPGEKLALIKQANKDAGLPDLSPEDEQRILTGFAQIDSENKFTPAGARRIAANLGTKILEETASPQEIIDFVAATTVLNQDITKLMPSGDVVRIAGVLTQTTRNALDKLNITADGTPVTPTNEAGPDNSGQKNLGKGTGSKVTEASVLSNETPAITFEETVFGASFFGTGFLSGVKGFVAGIPVIGETAFGRSPKVVKARQLLTLMQNELVDILRFSKRADKERIEIKQEISIEPQDLESPQRFRDRLVAIDDALAKRQQAAAKLINSAKIVGAMQKKEQRDFFNMVSIFREKLGVPTNFKSFEDARNAGLNQGAIIRIQGQYVTFGSKEKQ
jgi:hypothetical protein